MITVINTTVGGCTCTQLWCAVIPPPPCPLHSGNASMQSVQDLSRLLGMFVESEPSDDECVEGLKEMLKELSE